MQWIRVLIHTHTLGWGYCVLQPYKCVNMTNYVSLQVDSIVFCFTCYPLSFLHCRIGVSWSFCQMAKAKNTVYVYGYVYTPCVGCTIIHDRNRMHFVASSLSRQQRADAYFKSISCHRHSVFALSIVTWTANAFDFFSFWLFLFLFRRQPCAKRTSSRTLFGTHKSDFLTTVDETNWRRNSNGFDLLRKSSVFSSFSLKQLRSIKGHRMVRSEADTEISRKIRIREAMWCEMNWSW